MTGSSKPTDRQSAETSVVRSGLRTVARLAVDLLAIALWVLFLTLLFLETAWPRWAFYGMMLIGVGVYVFVTAPWAQSRSTARREP
ncbi:hypothetical protein EA462_07955 [Natrarchaeobius halalkaliphilus]|uniref:DUF8119 domain-containing protein n=1 Tax=Natrarchaeobius halalkaliphilus TaxID=1679091 RepID=A0A3N6LRW2_9EURY|nr:hypothetical protein [Natrarchaeobius halalkaliphilus]RQG89934.1 hypothetical protein EA462_07955 [Natrarchaeobius halalkaliphilus]